MVVSTRRTPVKAAAAAAAVVEGRAHVRWGRNAIFETLGTVVIASVVAWGRQGAGDTFNDLWVFGVLPVMCATIGFLAPAVVLQWVSTQVWADSYGITYAKVRRSPHTLHARHSQTPQIQTRQASHNCSWATHTRNCLPTLQRPSATHTCTHNGSVTYAPIEQLPH
jgi:hypothetical protein